MSDRDDLAAFIGELRARHAAGAFVGRADWRIGGGIILGDVRLAIGRMLEQVDDYRAMLPENRRAWAGPRQHLARELRGLRDYLKGKRYTEAELTRIRGRYGIGT